MSYAINSYVLTEQNSCINKAIHVLLIHGYDTLRVRFRGRHKIRRHHIKRALLETLFCDGIVTFVYPLKAALSKRRLKLNASIGAILDTRENERFETFSTIFY